MKARPSLQGLHLKCAGSIKLVNSRLPIVAAGAAADTGTWVHNAIAGYMKNGMTPSSFPGGDERFLFYRAIAMIDTGDADCPPLRPYMGGEIFVEHTVGDANATGGTLDLGWWLSAISRLVVFDFKTGRVETDTVPQTAGYAAELMLDLGIQPKEVWLGSGWLRDGFYKWTFTDGAFVMDTRNRLLDNIKRAECADPDDLSIFSSGPHCAGCPAALHCPATGAIMRPLVAMAKGSQGPQVPDLSRYSDEALAEFKAQIALMQKFVDMAGVAIKARAAASPIKLASGKVWGVREIGVKEWNPSATISLINRTLKPGTARECVKIVQEKLKDAVMDEAPARGKKAAWEEFCDRATQSGALTIRKAERFGEFQEEHLIESE